MKFFLLLHAGLLKLLPITTCKILIYEMQKQFYHGKEWYRAKQEQRLDEAKYRFKRWKISDDSLCQNDLEKMAQQKMQAEHE